MSRTKGMAGMGIAVAIALLGLGCTSTTADRAPQFSEKGEHPAGWMQDHWKDYSKNPQQCTTCHGSTTDPLRAGGISKVSCFTCHTGGPGHPAGWSAASQHGRAGAMVAPGTKEGFAYCFKCHGGPGVPALTATTCTTCHTKAPHPNAPWSSLDYSKPTHAVTNQAEAPVCYSCHKDGNNSTRKPSAPPAVGAAPGCFNNTMCHAYGH